MVSFVAVLSDFGSLVGVFPHFSYPEQQLEQSAFDIVPAYASVGIPVGILNVDGLGGKREIIRLNWLFLWCRTSEYCRPTLTAVQISIIRDVAQKHNVANV